MASARGAPGRGLNHKALFNSERPIYVPLAQARAGVLDAIAVRGGNDILCRCLAAGTVDRAQGQVDPGAAGMLNLHALACQSCGELLRGGVKAQPAGRLRKCSVAGVGIALHGSNIRSP